jgi:hypothetical protein
MSRIHSDREERLVFSRSAIGSVCKCACCSYYHLSLGNITLRLDHRDLLDLAEMLIEALERSAISDLNGRELNGNDA